MRARWSRYGVYLTAALVAATALTDWPSGLLSGFWVEHSMTAGLVSGLLLLFVGLVIVEAWIERQETRRWKDTHVVAHRGLGAETDVLRGVLAHLLDPSRTPLLERTLIKAYTDPELMGAIEERVAQLEPLPSSLSQRRRLLLQDAEWTRLTLVALEVLARRHREVLRAWAPVLLPSQRLAATLNDYAQLNDRIYWLCRPMRPSTRALSPGGDWQGHAVGLWRDLDISCIALYETSMRATGQPGWTHRDARSRLEDEDLAELETRSPARPLPDAPDPAARVSAAPLAAGEVGSGADSGVGGRPELRP